MKLRELITQKRTRIGMTQADLAKKTGLTQAQISDFESGKRAMNSDNVDKINEVLQISFAQKADEQWFLARECAITLKEKGYKNPKFISREEMADITGHDEILLLQVFSDAMFDFVTESRTVSEHNTYNYFLTLVNFHFASLK